MKKGKYMMKQLGNLAIVCAQRENTTLMMQRGQVRVVTYHRGGNITLLAAWDDDKRIDEIIHELNFGKYAEKAA